MGRQPQRWKQEANLLKSKLNGHLIKQIKLAAMSTYNTTRKNVKMSKQNKSGITAKKKVRIPHGTENESF